MGFVVRLICRPWDSFGLASRREVTRVMTHHDVALVQVGHSQKDIDFQRNSPDARATRFTNARVLRSYRPAAVALT